MEGVPSSLGADHGGTVISGSSIAMAATRSERSEHQRSERLRVFVDTAAISEQGRRRDEQSRREAPPPPVPSAPEPDDEGLIRLSPEDEKTLRLIEALFSKLLGKKVHLNIQRVKFRPPVPPPQAPPEPPPAEASPPRLGYRIEYEFRESYYEREQTSVQMAGRIQTQDGRSIEFAIDLGMSREFMSERVVQLTAGDPPVDPLVVNLEGGAARLGDQRFAFDLTGDGEQDMIRFLSSASAFLALDRDGNGTIDDGTELFGPSSGDGFAELRTLDADGNGWVDANDPAFQSLRLYNKDAQGQDQVSTLSEGGVEALYTGSIGSLFQIKDASNATLGQVRATGVYLGPNNRVGTTQQVDLAL